MDVMRPVTASLENVDIAEQAIRALAQQSPASTEGGHAGLDPPTDVEPQARDGVLCYCRKCDMKFGTFPNTWLDVSRVYQTPSSVISGDDMAVEESADEKYKSKGDLKGWGRYLFKFDKISVKSALHGSPIAIHIEGPLPEQPLGPNLDHHIVNNAHSGVSPQALRSPLLQETASGATKPVKESEVSDELIIKRLQAFCVHTANVLENQKQDIGRISGAVVRLEDNIHKLKNSMEEIRSSMHDQPRAPAPRAEADHDLPFQDLEFLTSNLIQIGRKANEVDELKMQLGLMKRRIRLLEEGKTGTHSTPPLAVSQKGAQRSERALDLERPTIAAPLREEKALLHPAKRKQSNGLDDASETYRKTNGHSKRTRLSDEGLDVAEEDDLPCLISDAPISYQNPLFDQAPTIADQNIAYTALNTTVGDDSDDTDYRPGYRLREATSSSEVRGYTQGRGRGSRGRPRKTRPVRLETPEWEKPGWTNEETSSGYYSVLNTPRGRVVRRGTGGGSFSEPRKVAIEKGLGKVKKPIMRDENGVRLKKNGEPDRRVGNVRAFNMRRKEKQEQERQRGLEQQSSRQDVAQLGGLNQDVDCFMLNPLSAATDTSTEILDHDRHARIMNKIFPGRVDNSPRRSPSLIKSISKTGCDDEVMDAAPVAAKQSQMHEVLERGKMNE
ncbi:MAG: hypothetical protein M1827_007060 [Pycnora praestabilis]|nr:MAG: hypothetical protein M1827_007060 [Pycnora praestabilis]